MLKLKPDTNRKPIKASNAPGIGYLYIAVILFFAIAAGTLLSGGFLPVDPNGPGGPPTLPPYWAEGGQDLQKIIFPSTTIDPKNNLQLKTFKINVCGSTSVIDFLIDTSGSMQFDNKIGRLKNGLTAFAKALSPSAVIGIQTFSATAKERVPLDYYKNNRARLGANIQSLRPEGWTSLRDGFQLTKTVLSKAITENKFPGYKYYMVLVSDGVPETPEASRTRTCLTPPGIVTDPLWDNPPGSGNGYRCFDPQQDPRGTPSNPTSNIADDIKRLGVEIFSIGVFSKSAISDQSMRPYLEALLKEVASLPTTAHYIGSDQDAVNLEEILKSLVLTICQDTIGGTN